MKVAPLFAVGNIKLKVFRKSIGQYVDGEWVDGDEEVVYVKANVQPSRYADTMLLPEPERTKKSIRIFTKCEIRIQKEGADGWGADEVEWEGERYKVMRVLSYKMQILNHYESIAVLVSRTP